MRKIEADTTRSLLKNPRTRRAAVGFLPSDPGRFILPPRFHLPNSGRSSARVRKHSPAPLPPHPIPRPTAARPAPPAGTWNAGTGAGTHAARPPRAPPANSPNSCGRSLGPRGGSARRSLQGHRHRGGSKVGGGVLSLPHGPLAKRPAAAKNQD